MVVINERFSVPDAELEWHYARSGGPGGQNVNKVSSKAELRWRLAENATLPAEAMLRLRGHQRNRITKEGVLLIVSQKFRDQEANRRECEERLRAMVLESLEAPKTRHATKPTRGSKRRRLAAKRHRSDVKQGRRGRPENEG